MGEWGSVGMGARFSKVRVFVLCHRNTFPLFIYLFSVISSIFSDFLLILRVLDWGGVGGGDKLKQGDHLIKMWK